MALCIAPLCCPASPAFEEVLQEADRVRSSDRAKLKTLLETLDARKQEADLLQRQRLQYVQIYSMAVYENRLAAAIAQAAGLLEQAVDMDLRFRTGSLLANLHTINRDFGIALGYLDQTMPLRHRVADKDIRHDGINTASTLYQSLGQHELVLVHAKEVLSDSPNPRARCNANHYRLAALASQGRLPIQDDSVHEVIQQCALAREPLSANWTRFVLAQKMASQGRPDEAIALLRPRIAEVEATGYARFIGEIHALLASFLLETGDIAGAEAHARSAIERAAGIKNSLPLVMAHKVMYDIAERRGDPVLALSHYRSYAEADKGYLDEIQAREVAYQVSRREGAEKTQKILLLDRHNQLLQMEQRIQRQSNQNLALLAVLLASLVAALSIWAFKVRRLHVSLRRFAETDALTGISNRHHFTRQAERALEQCAKDREPAAVIMFDLDRFKAINDTYGHDAGDWVLRQVTSTCAGLFRGIDHFARIGGEEFAILLQGCDLPMATRLAEDLRVRIAGIDSRESGHAFSVTASFGVAATRVSGYALATLMSHADLMLYRAKREGRNRVHGHTGEIAPSSPLPERGIPAAKSGALAALSETETETERVARRSC